MFPYCHSILLLFSFCFVIYLFFFFAGRDGGGGGGVCVCVCGGGGGGWTGSFLPKQYNMGKQRIQLVRIIVKLHVL